MATGTGVSRIQLWTAEQSVDQDVVLGQVGLQLRAAQDGIGTGVDKGRDGDWAGDGDAVFQVAVQTEVAARSYKLLVRHRDIPAVAGASRGGCEHWKPGVGGNERPIGVPERYGLGAGQVGDGRDGADVETAQIIFATQVGSFERGRNHSGEARDKRSLKVVTEGVAFVVHGEKLFVLDDGPDGVNRAAEASKLPADEQAFAMVGGVGGIEGVHGEAGGDLAGDDAAERVGAGDASEVEILEQQLGSVADRDQRRTIEGVADANPLEGTAAAQRIA